MNNERHFSDLIMKNQEGQSLFELVMAIGVCALIAVGVVSIANNSIQNSTYSKDQSIASSYAQEATEWLREQRDANISTFISNSSINGTYWCLLSEPLSGWPSSGACTSAQTINGMFTRQVKLVTTTVSTKTQIEADVTVSWTDAKGIHQVTNSTNFSDWRQR